MEGDERNDLEDELASFRQQWHEELIGESSVRDRKPKTKLSKGKDYEVQNTSIEEKAADLFLEGVKNENEGNFNAAVYFYRQAVHLVPDIEFKIAERQVTTSHLSEDEDDIEEVEGGSFEQSENSVELDDITRKFHLMNVAGLCCPNIPQNGTHISALPTELLLLVIRWVVSKDLDARSLERLSMVCRWFYACARDEEIWKLICIRVWGINSLSINLHNNCWRHMFLEKPHVEYDGVYISANSYVRIGEASLDSFYKPCHLVEYYKYLRFFTDGSVLVYTSAEEPQSTVQLLHQPPYRDPSIYVGYYRLTGDNLVNVFFTRITKPQETRRRRNREASEAREQNFFMQLVLKSTKKKRNNQLTWESYTYNIKNRKTGATNENDINTDSFRAFVFSGVKSYCSRSTIPL